jgi:hypothetical protein
MSISFRCSRPHLWSYWRGVEVQVFPDGLLPLGKGRDAEQSRLADVNFGR